MHDSVGHPIRNQLIAPDCDGMVPGEALASGACGRASSPATIVTVTLKAGLEMVGLPLHRITAM